MTEKKRGSSNGESRKSLHNASTPSVGEPNQLANALAFEALQVRSNRAQGVVEGQTRPGNSGRAFQRIIGVPDFFGVPASPLAIGLGVNESAILRVLSVARELVSKGWAQQVAWCDAEGRTTPADMGPATHFSIVGAIRTAGAGELVAEYALKLVGKVLGERDLQRWQDNPVRNRGQVLELLDDTIKAAGGKQCRRGGWRIGGAA